jgi:hypothetical protein
MHDDEITAERMSQALARLQEYWDVFMSPTTAEPERDDEKRAWAIEHLRKLQTPEGEAEAGNAIANLSFSQGLSPDAMRTFWNGLMDQRSPLTQIQPECEEAFNAGAYIGLVIGVMLSRV